MRICFCVLIRWDAHSGGGRLCWTVTQMADILCLFPCCLLNLLLSNWPTQRSQSNCDRFFDYIWPTRRPQSNCDRFPITSGPRTLATPKSSPVKSCLMFQPMFLIHAYSCNTIYFANLSASLLRVRIRINTLDRAVGVVLQFGVLHAALVVDAFRQRAVVIEQIPFVFHLHNGVMSCPADNG